MTRDPAWLDRLERRCGHWAVPQLASFLVGMNAVVWVLGALRPAFPGLLRLDPALALGGQPWRLFTFLFLPPAALGPVGAFLWLYLLFTYATALERAWGDFRFNLYYGCGALATAAASLALGEGLSNLTLNASLFLAFAELYPDFELLLFFVLPVKVRWLAWLFWAGAAWGALAGGTNAFWGLAAGLCNYALFFGPGRWEDARLAARRWLWRRRNRGG